MALVKQNLVPHQIVSPSPDIPHSTWVEIDAAAFNHNVSSYASIVQPALLAPVIKSNAYGHGLEIIAQLCEKHESVDYLCVVSLSEAVSLRGQGIKKPILVLSILDGSLERAVQYDIDVVVYNEKDVITLHHYAMLHNKPINVHVKVDTGLSRLGLLHDAALIFIKDLARMPLIVIKGIFTHCAFSESSDQTYTNQQLENFDRIVTHLEQHNISIPLKHTSCSAAATANLASHYTMVRAGIGMYGLWPSDENKSLTLAQYPGFSLKPVMTWKTRVIQVKEIPAGSCVGYNLTFRAQRDTQIAVLCVGYWDGLDRRLSNQGTVLIKNQLVPIIGIVAMNLCMIDVTELEVQAGDEVTLLGNHPGIRANDMAKKCSTINYEIVTRINPLAPRIITI